MSFETTPFLLADEPVDFPALASGVAIKNAAKRFETAFTLPAEAAFAMAASIVDPAEVRAQIDAKDPRAHLQVIQTPDGKFLLAQQTRVWTHMISGDGGNGRSRYELQKAKVKPGEVRPRPWPIGRHHKPAVVAYDPVTFSDMETAVRKSAEQIRSQDLVTQVSLNPRGVWNPPVVVLARAFVTNDGGTITERWFLHTIEGSTRVEACHELTDVDAAAPFRHSADPLDWLREMHKGHLDRFAKTPAAFRSLAAARAAHMPALIVVGAIEGDLVTPIASGFPEIISDYVESVHIQPRPFSDVAQSNVIGERFVQRLANDGRMSAESAEALLGRSAEVPGKPSVRAATLVHTVCDAANDLLLREFLVTEPRSRLTKVKRAKLVGPLVVRQFDAPDDTAERALMRPFTPDTLLNIPWSISGVDSETLRQRCLADVAAATYGTPVLAELMARGGPALCAAGVLLSDQGSTVEGIAALRGPVDKVIEALAKKAGGVEVLADAVAWADRERPLPPRVFEVDGTPRTDDHGDQEYYTTDWRSGNMLVRALALTEDGQIPKKTKSNSPKPLPLTPEQKYRINEKNLVERLMAAHVNLQDIVAAVDEHGVKLITKLGMAKHDIYDVLPDQLTKTYARYSSEADFFEIFNEDDLPDAGPGTSEDGDDEDSYDEDYEADAEEDE